MLTRPAKSLKTKICAASLPSGSKAKKTNLPIFSALENLPHVAFSLRVVDTRFSSYLEALYIVLDRLSLRIFCILCISYFVFPSCTKLGRLLENWLVSLPKLGFLSCFPYLFVTTWWTVLLSVPFMFGLD